MVTLRHYVEIIIGEVAAVSTCQMELNEIPKDTFYSDHDQAVTLLTVCERIYAADEYI
jgi:hypothetical protein